MIRRTILSSWRNLLRNRIYTLINILGVSLGLAACLMIWLVAQREFSFDRFHTDLNLIYRVVTYEQYAGGTAAQMIPAVVPPLPNAMSETISTLEECAPYHLLGGVAVEPNTGNENKSFISTTAVVTTPAYFKIMQYEWLAGSPETSLQEPNSIVLTEQKARVYFGNIPPSEVRGKELTYDGNVTVNVTGVVRDWNQRTDFPFTEFISLPTIGSNGSWREDLQMDKWKGGVPLSSRVLIKLVPQVSPSDVQTALDKLFISHWRTGLSVRVEIQPLSEVHFAATGEESTTNFGNLASLFMFSGIALFILLLAVMNYINLFTAQTISRSKEMTIRKILGSDKWILIFQLMCETLILVLIAMVVVCAMVNPILAIFKQFIASDIQLDLLNIDTILILVSLVVITTLAAGLYPAWNLSSVRIGRTLSDVLSRDTRGIGLRRALIVFQFSTSLVFIISALLVDKQIDFMIHSDHGFDSNAVIEFSTNDRSHMDHVRLLETRIGSIPGVIATARQNMPPMGLDRGYTGLQFNSAGDGLIQVAAIKADENFVSLYHIKLIAGRNLLPSDSLKEILVNETLCKILGFGDADNAIGQVVTVWNRQIPIVGVVADFHQADFHQPILPQIIMGVECSDIAVKLDNNGKSAMELQNIIAQIEQEWKRIYPEDSFEYKFIDSELNSLYTKEQTTAWLMNFATSITIFVSCIGLLGLTLFSVKSRVKEISIRKVLGATADQIVKLFLTDFLLLVLVALLIASPIAWYGVNHWLENFAYRTNISWWIFVVGGLIAAGLATLTVSLLCIRAAKSNPIEGLISD